MASVSVDFAKYAEVLAYDKDTGLMTWKVRRGCRAAGQRAGSPKSDGYLELKTCGKSTLVHRVAWLLATGNWPKFDIDHLNGIKSDNRLCNLRDVPVSINTQNQRKARSDNTTGFLGVSVHPKGFLAQIMLAGKMHKLGVHKSAAEAHSTYLIAKRQMHSGCTI